MRASYLRKLLSALIFSGIFVLYLNAAESISKSEKANQYFKEGLQLYLDGSYRKAISTFIEAVKNEPGHIGAKAFILKSNEKLVQEQEAKEKEQQELEEARLKLAKEKDKKLKDTAEETLESRAKKRAREHYMKGLEFASENNYAMALKEWDLSLLWNPDNPELETKVSGVKKELEILSTSNLLEKRIGQAYSFYQEGNMVDSLESWRQVQVLDPANKSALEYIDEITAKLTKKELQTYLARIQEKEKEDIRTNTQNGETALKAGQYDSAMAYFNKVLRIDPKNINARNRLNDARKAKADEITKNTNEGIILFNQGKIVQSIGRFHKVLTLDPENKKAKEYMEKARKSVAEGEKTAKDNAVRKMYYEAADMYMQGQYDSALSAVNKILEIDPDNNNAYRLLDRIQRVNKITSAK